MVKLQPSKLAIRVRFPLPAPYLSLVAPASLKPPLCPRYAASRPAVVPTHFVVGIHGWAPGGTRFPTHFVVGTRSPPPAAKRSAGFFAAFCRALVPPTTKRVGGLRVGARAEMRYAAARREPNPASDPRSSRHASRSGLAYARRSNPPDGGFPTPLVRPRLPRPFFGQNRSLLGLWRPPRLHFTQKIAPKGAARPPATRPECPATRETRGHLLNGGLPARRGLWTAPDGRSAA